MGKRIDLTGKVFYRWFVIGFSHRTKDGTYWLCKCNCGNEKSISGKSLRRGLSKSCGCLKKELAGKHSIKHGMTNTKTYKSRKALNERCNNKNHIEYKRYGGRGIKVLWKSFEEFYQDMGERPLGLSIDRIDNNGNYCKENCKRSTKKEQNNNARTNRFIEINGIKKTVAQWCDEYKINYGTVSSRLNNYGRNEIQAIITPSLGIGKKRKIYS